MSSLSRPFYSHTMIPVNTVVFVLTLIYKTASTIASTPILTTVTLCPSIYLQVSLK